MGIVGIHRAGKIEGRVLQRMFFHHKAPPFRHPAGHFLHHGNVGRIGTDRAAKIPRHRIPRPLQAKKKNFLPGPESEPRTQRRRLDARSLILERHGISAHLLERRKNASPLLRLQWPIPALRRIRTAIHQKSLGIEKTRTRQRAALGHQIWNPRFARLAIEPQHGVVRIGIVENHAFDFFTRHPFAQSGRALEQGRIGLENFPPQRLDVPRTSEGIFPHQQGAPAVPIRQRQRLGSLFFELLETAQKHASVRIRPHPVVRLLRHGMPGMKKSDPLLKKQIAQQPVGGLPSPVFHHRVEIVLLAAPLPRLRKNPPMPQQPRIELLVLVAPALELRAIPPPRQIPEPAVNIRRGARGDLLDQPGVPRQRGMLKPLEPLFRRTFQKTLRPLGGQIHIRHHQKRTPVLWQTLNLHFPQEFLVKPIPWHQVHILHQHIG